MEYLEDNRGASEVEEIINNIEQIFQYWDGCESAVLYDKGSMKVEMMTESFSDVFDKFAAIYKILFGKKDLEEVQYANRIMSSVEKRSYCGSKTSNNE